MNTRLARHANRHSCAVLTLSFTGSLLGFAPCGAAWGAPGPAADQQMLSIDPLVKYTLPDQTASVMLPDGWHVTRTGIAFIRAEGPRGELGFFGLVVPARDAPTGSGPTPGAPLSQPYSADTGDKIEQSINWVRASNGQSPVKASVISQQSFTAPAEFGQCSRVVMRLGVQNLGTLNSEADFCSLPTDQSGNYRNFMKIVAAPPEIAAAQRGTLEAVLASYVLNMKAVQAQLAQRGGAQQASQDATTAPTASSRMTQSAASPAAHSSTAMSRGGSSYQSLQQKINAEIAQGGFSPQMVAAMRAQATAQANARIAPMMNQMRTFDQGIDYFDRSVLRGQIPVSITHAGTFWIDPN